ncbi:MAG TPA: hypothetical protein VLN59_08155, partial [Burkholderiales bacterium]|nr:hypothetical protein [Burkholderiales bacterium]
MADNIRTNPPLKRGHYKSVPGKYYGTPKELWDFRTAAARGSPKSIARDFATTNAKLFELEPDLRGLKMKRVILSLGGAHVIMQQVHAGRRVNRAYVTVHMDRGGHVYLAKNRSVPARLLPESFENRIGRVGALRRARHSLPRRGRRAELREIEQLWFPREAEILPAWKLRLTRHNPREEWIV